MIQINKTFQNSNANYVVSDVNKSMKTNIKRAGSSLKPLMRKIVYPIGNISFMELISYQIDGKLP